MRQLIYSRDESFVLSAQLALDAQGIHHKDLRAGVGEGAPDRIMVEDDDFERSVEVLRGLQETSPYAGEWTDRTFRRFAIWSVVALVVIVAALFLAR